MTLLNWFAIDFAIVWLLMDVVIYWHRLVFTDNTRSKALGSTFVILACLMAVWSILKLAGVV